MNKKYIVVDIESGASAELDKILNNHYELGYTPVHIFQREIVSHSDAMGKYMVYYYRVVFEKL